MLVLSRRRNQVIQIGENIRITIVNIRGSCVKLAIEAPREVPVHRAEVRARIDAETYGVEAAAALASPAISEV